MLYGVLAYDFTLPSDVTLRGIGEEEASARDENAAVHDGRILDSVAFCGRRTASWPNGRQNATL
jgi:hypothetical protein